MNVPLPADLCAAAGTITVAAPIAGDAMLAGGTVDVQQPVAGDVRVAGGRVTVEGNVGGDLMAAGGIVNVSAKAKDAHIAGGTVQMSDGANGPVTIYGADVSIAGTFDGNVEIVAADHISIDPSTVIHGTFKYNAPQQADIPDSAVIDGGVNYIGANHYLPTTKEAQQFAVAGLWVFIFVRLAALLAVTGLIVGLFPALTDKVIQGTITRNFERFVLMFLLGLAGFVAVPILFLLLIVSFVGIGIALVIGAAYLVFLLFAYIYAAALAGSMLMWVLKKKTVITWRGALLGVVVLYIVGLIPVVGFLVRAVLSAAAGGALLLIFYRFAFPRTSIDISEL